MKWNTKMTLPPVVNTGSVQEMTGAPVDGVRSPRPDRPGAATFGRMRSETELYVKDRCYCRVQRGI